MAISKSNTHHKYLAVVLFSILLIVYSSVNLNQNQNHKAVLSYLLIGLIAFTFSLLLFTNEKIWKFLLTIVLILSVCFLTLNVVQAPFWPFSDAECSPHIQEATNATKVTNGFPKLMPTNSMYKYSMFFVESNYDRSHLTTKEMCAIESAAKNNPNALVQLHTFSAKLNKSANALIQKYPNLRIIKFEPYKFFNNTPLMSWYMNGSVLKSPHSYAHIADAFRLAILWKYGGVYSDLDTITLRSFEPLIKSGKSGFGYLPEGIDSIGNGLLVFTRNHSYLNYILNRFREVYNPNEWGSNGPVLVWNAALKFCNISNIHVDLMPSYKDSYYNRKKQKLDEKSTRNKKSRRNRYRTTTPKPVYLDPNHVCANLTIFPQEYFYPLTYVDNDQIYAFSHLPGDADRIDSYVDKVRNSYSIHFFGKLSSEQHTKAEDMSFYNYMASEHCDFTFNYVEDNDLEFFR